MKKRNPRQLDPHLRRSVKVMLYLSPRNMERIDRYRRSMQKIPSTSGLCHDIVVKWLDAKDTEGI
jgi:hypothetical protein